MGGKKIFKAPLDEELSELAKPILTETSPLAGVESIKKENNPLTAIR